MSKNNQIWDNCPKCGDEIKGLLERCPVCFPKRLDLKVTDENIRNTIVWSHFLTVKHVDLEKLEEMSMVFFNSISEEIKEKHQLNIEFDLSETLGTPSVICVWDNNQNQLINLLTNEIMMQTIYVKDLYKFPALGSAVKPLEGIGINKIDSETLQKCNTSMIDFLMSYYSLKYFLGHRERFIRFVLEKISPELVA